MKNIKIITVILATLFAATGLYAQNAIPPYRPLSDFGYKPKEYMQYNFVERKELYIGKPLSKLLQDLEVPIISFSDISHGTVMEDVGIEFFFESGEVISYRTLFSQRDIPFHQRKYPLSFEIIFEDAISGHITERRRLRYGNNWHIINAAFYGEQIVRDISISGENPSDLPPLPADFFDDSDITPCCAPRKVPVPQEDAHLNAEIKERLVLIDELQRPPCSVSEVRIPCNALNQDNCNKVNRFACWNVEDTVFYYRGQAYRGKLQKSVLVQMHIGNQADSVSLNKMFDLAKNTFVPQSVLLRSYFSANYTKYPDGQPKAYHFGERSLLRERGVLWYPDAYDRTSQLFSQFIETIPASRYDFYKFKAPSGYQLYQFLRSRRHQGIPTNLEDAFFIAYDGSVYNLRVNKKMYKHGQYYNQSSGLVADLTNAIAFMEESAKLFYPPKDERDSMYLKWGFIAGGLLYDEFVDAFYYFYNEGRRFSKDDAYVSALAYILEPRGFEIYRRAPGETDFKRYNTTVVHNERGNIINFNATVWE